MSAGCSQDVRQLRNARRRRREWARRFHPDAVALLLVAEAPPSDLDRYFYFPDVTRQDSLFRHVARSVLGAEPTRANKPELLRRLRDKGVYLIDLSPEPKAGGNLEPFVPALVHRIQKIRPASIILIKTNVYDAAFVALREAALPVVDVRVQFPGSGQQKRFVAAFAEALRRMGFNQARVGE